MMSSVETLTTMAAMTSSAQTLRQEMTMYPRAVETESGGLGGA